ncbi:MAG TPA: hypothetical protein VE869_07285 [Gemmatimonas sp.]|nr:hypothetical protein [Gemmatimonas sp.]
MQITLALRAILVSHTTRRALLPALMLFVPVTTQTQPKGCPSLARVPGYGACSNTGGRSCSFCTYRCNDDTVVSWNVCAT